MMNSMYQKIMAVTLLSIVILGAFVMSMPAQADERDSSSVRQWQQNRREAQWNNRGWSTPGNYYYNNANPYFYSNDYYYYNASPNPYPENYNYDRDYNPSAHPYWFGDTPY